MNLLIDLIKIIGIVLLGIGASTIIGILTGQLLRYRRKQYEKDYESFYED